MVNSFAVLDEYLDNKEDCYAQPDNQEMIGEIDDIFIELNKIDNNSTYTNEKKMELSSPYCSKLYSFIGEKPFLVCAYFLDESKLRSNKSLVSQVFTYAMREHCFKYKLPDVMFSYAELCRVHYCYERLNDSFVHDLYNAAAKKGHKLAAVRLRQEQEIRVAHKLVMTPYDKGVVCSNNVAKGISMFFSLFKQGRLDVVSELLQVCVEVKAWDVIKDTLYFLDNPSYTEQFMAQVNTISKEEYLNTLRKLYRKAKWHVVFQKMESSIRVFLYIALFVFAGWLFMIFKNESFYFLISFFFVYFSIGKFIVENPLYSLFCIPFIAIRSTFGAVGSMDWDSLGEALIISSLI